MSGGRAAAAVGAVLVLTACDGGVGQVCGGSEACGGPHEATVTVPAP